MRGGGRARPDAGFATPGETTTLFRFGPVSPAFPAPFSFVYRRSRHALAFSLAAGGALAVGAASPLALMLPSCRRCSASPAVGAAVFLLPPRREHRHAAVCAAPPPAAPTLSRPAPARRTRVCRCRRRWRRRDGRHCNGRCCRRLRGRDHCSCRSCDHCRFIGAAATAAAVAAVVAAAVVAAAAGHVATAAAASVAAAAAAAVVAAVAVGGFCRDRCRRVCRGHSQGLSCASRRGFRHGCRRSGGSMAPPPKWPFLLRLSLPLLLLPPPRLLTLPSLPLLRLSLLPLSLALPLSV